MTRTEYLMRIHEEMTWAAQDEAYRIGLLDEPDYEATWASRTGDDDPRYWDYMADQAADRYEDALTAGW